MKKTQKKKRATALFCAWLLCILSALMLFGTIGAAALTQAEDTSTGWGVIHPVNGYYLPEVDEPDSTGSKASIVTLVETIFASFSTVINSLAGGLKTAFANLLYIDPAAASPKLSPVVLFLFTMAGVGLAAGILYKMFGLIQSKRRG